MAVLSPAQLRGLKSHKYKAQGISITEIFVQPFWNWLVTLIPMWVAPNLITFTGLLVNIITCIAVMLTDLNMTGQSPLWLYFLTAIGIFVYQTLDGVDGKQARRTGTANALGELFDHGCDAVSTFVVAIAGISACGMNDHPYVTLGFLILIEFVNYIYHWQTYVSGCLYFKKVDVTEAQFCNIITLMITYLFGTGIWSILFPGIGVPLKLLLTVGVIVFGIVNSISAFVIIFSQGIGKNGATSADTSVLSPIIPVVILVGCSVHYSVFSPSLMLHNHAVLFYTAMVGPFVKLALIMMVAGICKSPLPLIDVLYVGPVVAVLNVLTGTLLPEYYLLIAICIFNIYDLLQFFVSVVIEVCKYLEVSCFTIPYTPSSSTTSSTSSDRH